MSSGHKTSAIPRPPSATRVQINDHTRLSDFTRPIREARQLVRGKKNRWALAMLALVVIFALLGALFVLPVQAWLHQKDDLAAKRAQLEILEGATAQIETDVARLNTLEGAKEAARDELGLVSPGEIRISMLDVADAPVTLPAGWPYDAVNQIVAARTRTRAAVTPPPTTAAVVATTSTQP